MKFIRIKTINENIRNIESNYAENHQRVYNKQSEKTVMLMIEATTQEKIIKRNTIPVI